jgi:hypothetical protein
MKSTTSKAAEKQKADIYDITKKSSSVTGSGRSEQSSGRSDRTEQSSGRSEHNSNKSEHNSGRSQHTSGRTSPTVTPNGSVIKKTTSTGISAPMVPAPNPPLVENVAPDLTGYILVAPADYDNIEIGAHLKYLRNDGKWVKGGYLQYITNKNNVKRIQIQNKTNKKQTGYMSWGVKCSEVSKLYKKSEIEKTFETGKMYESLIKQQNEIISLKKQIELLNKKMEILEKAVVSYVKK